jgi:hypothetical protein
MMMKRAGKAYGSKYLLRDNAEEVGMNHCTELAFRLGQSIKRQWKKNHRQWEDQVPADA